MQFAPDCCVLWSQCCAFFARFSDIITCHDYELKLQFNCFRFNGLHFFPPREHYLTFRRKSGGWSRIPSRNNQTPVITPMGLPLLQKPGDNCVGNTEYMSQKCSPVERGKKWTTSERKPSLFNNLSKYL